MTHFVTLTESGRVLDLYDDANGNVPEGAVPVEVAFDLMQIAFFDWLKVVDGKLQYVEPPATSK